MPGPKSKNSILSEYANTRELHKGNNKPKVGGLYWVYLYVARWTAELKLFSLQKISVFADG